MAARDSSANGSLILEMERDRTSTADRIYNELKQDIMWGNVPPGSLLSEIRLADHFGASRTPVRQALSMLAKDGLITTLPQRGHLVRTVSISEMLDAFRLREILEVEAAAQAAHHISEEEIARLRALAVHQTLDQMEANRDFHLSIARASGNRILVDFIERLLMQMQSVLALDPHLNQWTREGMEIEIEILDALAARDEEAVAEAMGKHIRQTLSAVLHET